MKIMFLILLTLALTGCDNYTTPNGAVETVAGYLKSGDLPNFKKGLEADALKKFGSVIGMAALSTQFAGLTGTRTEVAVLVSTKRVANGYQTELRTYDVGILAGSPKEVRVLTATVTCKIYRVRRCAPGGLCTGIDFDEYSECRMSGLR